MSKSEAENQLEAKPTPMENEKKDSEHTKKNKKRKEFAPYGNYRNYYGYRIGHGLDGDPRLKVFKKEWFEEKDCLDIGCNAGSITIDIAIKFNCRAIRGIDIDKNRVEDANWNLRKIARTGPVTKKRIKTAEPRTEGMENGTEQAASITNKKSKDTCEDQTFQDRDLFTVVSFQQENFVQTPLTSIECYDTIVCLSVSKWIHLNWGDDGLITLFSKCWRLLRPGGVFVLEPQPWRSYEKNRHASEATAKNYKSIVLRPEQFREILLDKIGFRRIEDLTSNLSGTKTGFDRSILVFFKCLGILFKRQNPV